MGNALRAAGNQIGALGANVALLPAFGHPPIVDTLMRGNDVEILHVTNLITVKNILDCTQIQFSQFENELQQRDMNIWTDLEQMRFFVNDRFFPHANYTMANIHSMIPDCNNVTQIHGDLNGKIFFINLYGVMKRI